MNQLVKWSHVSQISEYCVSYLRGHLRAELVLVVAVQLQLAVAAREPVARLAEQRQALLRTTHSAG